MLYEMYAKVREEQTIPKDWNESHLVKIPKTGNLTNCNNYTGITMLSVMEKSSVKSSWFIAIIPKSYYNSQIRVILNSELTPPFSVKTDEILRDQQMGFRKNRPCTDHIATLRIITEQSLEWNTSF